MPQFFHPSTNTISRLTIYGALFAIAFLTWAAAEIARSSYETMESAPREQPVPFSHAHHAGGLGIDCRYCHTSVEVSSFANIPPTEICMNCHSQMWASSPMLEPVRASYVSGKSIEWNRVNDLPEFVYFNHSIHINKGIGCSSCHGRVDKMPLTWQASSLQMEWCLNCHRNPERYVRPREHVFNMDYQYPPDQLALGARLVKEYHIQRLDTCYTCHR
jgi:Cytochrome c7 and related cytochrome c